MSPEILATTARRLEFRLTSRAKEREQAISPPPERRSPDGRKHAGRNETKVAPNNLIAVAAAAAVVVVLEITCC